MRIMFLVIVGVFLTGCTSTQDLSKGSGVFGGGVQHTEIKPGLYSITAQTNWAPWSNFSGARRAWKNVADDLCGKEKYRELGISQAAKDTGMAHMGHLPGYIVTEQRGYALCNSSQITPADAAGLIETIPAAAAGHQ